MQSTESIQSLQKLLQEEIDASWIQLEGLTEVNANLVATFAELMNKMAALAKMFNEDRKAKCTDPELIDLINADHPELKGFEGVEEIDAHNFQSIYAAVCKILQHQQKKLVASIKDI